VNRRPNCDSSQLIVSELHILSQRHGYETEP
jgi:hypothetical protein